jgi:hypothetical protein
MQHMVLIDISEIHTAASCVRKSRLIDCYAVVVHCRQDGQLIAEAQEAFVHRIPAQIGELGKLASEQTNKACS